MEKQVTVNGVGYLVKEAKVRDMMQFMSLLSEDPQKFQIELAKASVCKKDGTPLGDALLDLGIKAYSELIGPVMESNGFLGQS